MNFKTILCVVGVSDSDEQLKDAISLCQNNELHLAVLVVGVIPPAPTYSYGAVVDTGWADDLAKGRELAVDRGNEIEIMLQKADVSGDVDVSYCEYGQMDDVIGARARFTDLTLIAPMMENENDLREKTVYGALYQSAKPILLVPKGGLKQLAADRIMIAWDDGLPAIRAVGRSLDLLKNAKDVHVVLVDPLSAAHASGQEPGADLARYLVRHGIKITVENLTSAGRPVEKVLQQHAIDMNADLIVMGAYGHSRLKQLVFGGTTSSMIDHPSLPVLMSH